MVKSKRVYEKRIDHGHDMSYENEITYDSVNAPAHYLHGRKETIDVITDCMTNDEFHGYLKGNILKYVSRYKFKGEPLEDLQKAHWYLNRLIKEVSNGAS
ncbi:putative protein 1.7 [uncultured virus]|jgi:hypothetical protein|uniref:DUF3310 domain-containing protein n=1 Tax=uncultured virus TaxID=340016 RepID=A0A218MLR8_9VIRU|nr:putative protein 1.7 [uncultured virus]|tara:strand:- start:409 stop:708 length:300 start_codon:yes stop_codon:yes gene_type:complete